MVKQKVKYILSAVLMFCIAFAFIFSTVFKITNRDVSKALAIDVSSVQEFKDALTNGTDSEIVITQDMEIPCEQIDESAGAGNIQTAEIIINRSATIKSGGDGIKTIKRTGKDGAKNNLRSLFEVAGNGVEVTFEDVVLDGGASLPVTSGRIYYTGDETVKGRSLIDVCQGSTLNVGNGCTIQNSFADSSISTHGYSTSLPCCGGAIRTDFYSDNNGIDMRGGTINLLNGSTVKDCSTKAIAADWVTPLENYGGAVAAYDLGTINIYGGSTISSCTSSNGGAIGICHGTSTPYVTGSLNIYGGSFNDCRALKGGAVNVGKNDNESNDPKFKLLAETATTFNECQATGNGSAGNTFYVDEGNKIYLAPYYTKIEGGQEVVVGNVSISSNCFGGEGDGSYDGQLPENLKGYTKHMHFQAYNGDGARENEKVVTEGLVNVKIKIEPVDDSTKYTAIIDGDLSEDDLTYKWYESADGTNWQEVNNQTGKELVVNNTDENKYYKVDVTSGSSGSKASAQTKFLDDAIEELKVTTSKNGENKTTYTANITYKDPETAGESVVGPKYQWYEVTDEGTPVKINGATSKTYTPENDDGSKTYKVVISSDYYKGTKEAQSEPGGVDPSNAVFKVGSGDNWTYFDNLKNAFSSVSSGESIVALKDYTLTEEAVLGTSSVSIDLDGHTITQTDAAKIRIRNTSGTVNISNGTVVGNLDMVADGPQDNDEYIYGAIKLENMTVQGAIYNDGHPLNITSGKYESVVANRFSTNTISGGTFSGNVESYDGANINITSGYFSGNINKSENGGEIKISGGKFVNEPDVNYIKDGFETFDDKGETVDGVYYGYEVLKQRPTESLFSIEGLTQTYDGTGKGVTVTEKNGGHEFDGKITVTYCKELDIGTDAETWTPELPIDVEFYKVKIQIAETENYSATQFTRTFNIAKSTPEAGMFTFNANDVPYDGESKKAQVTFNEKYDSNFPDVVHTGMGEVTVHYYKDSDCKYELFYPDKEVKNAGTYYVGVTVASGKNYFATEEGKVLRKEDWKFSITKLVPTADLFEIKDNEYIYDGQRKAVTVEEKSGKSEFRDKFRVKYYYEKEGVTDWYYDAPTEKGDYRVSIEIKDAENYEDKVVEFDNSSNLKINKATPTVDMFNFSASDATYDGESKEAQVTFNEKYDSNFPDVVHTGMGEVTVHYYKDQECTDEVSKENVKNAGTYYVGITVADGRNYSAQSSVIYGDSWHFRIKKDVAIFKFVKPDPSEGKSYIVYDRSEKKAKVTIDGASEDINSKIKLYYKEVVSEGEEPQWSETIPKNSGTYKVGITLDENEKYEALTEILTDDSWQFTIEKAEPTVDLFYDVHLEDDVYDGLAKKILYSFKYPEDDMTGVNLNISVDGQSWYVNSYPIIAGKYHVSFSVANNRNYQDTVAGTLTRPEWDVEVKKADPEIRLFLNLKNNNIYYDGTGKKANVEFSGQYVDQQGRQHILEGIGNFHVKYSKDGVNWTDELPINAGTYRVGVVTEGGDNFNPTKEGEVLTNANDDRWTIVIHQAEPNIGQLFNISTGANFYDGRGKGITVEEKGDKHEFDGKVVVKYRYAKGGVEDWYQEEPIDVGEYNIKIELGETLNYTSKDFELGDGFKLKIVEGTPTADMFNFSANDVPYDGESKKAQVTFNEKYDSNFPDVVHTGMGEVTVHYYKDKECTDEVSKENVKNAGMYYVGITVASGKNYFATEEGKVLRKEDWKFSITKLVPTADLFEIKDNEYIYDGQRKAVTVEEKSGKSEFRDKFRVKYYYEKEGVTDWYYDAPTEKGDYRVSIEIKDAENYEDKVVEFDNSSNLKINKATPTVDMFNFSASDATYDGESKEAQVTFNEKYDSNFPDVVHTGMGEVTVHYYKDQGRTDEVSKENVRNAGTYYVGITVADGKNYFATEEGKVLRKEDWKFVINKAKPTLDFTVINGGITGNEPQLKTDDKKEIFYGKTLGDSKDILPKSGIGTWSFKDQGQVMKPVGEQYVDLVFTPKDTENYDWSNVLGYDPSTERLNVKLLVSTVVDKSGWGDKVKVGKEGTVENYVDNDKNSPNKGSTSVEITGDGIHWLKETSFDVDLGHNTTAWYGIDNSSGIFERGSRFLIRWINRAENSNEWDETNKGIDNTEVQNMPDKKKWIFIAEVIHPDGTHKYEKLSQSVPLYVQLGEDWDKDDVKAYFISQSGKDEEVSREPLTMLCPEGEKEFFKLELLHFSPYTIYDVDPVSSNTDESRTVSPGNGEESNSTQKEENYSEAEKSNNSDTDNRNSQNYKESENSDGGKSSTQENTKNGIKSWYIIAGGSLLLLALLLGWWLLYKKRKKEKDVIRKSFFASLASSARK